MSLHWFLKALESKSERDDVATPQAYVATYYAKGLGVPQNYTEAIHWYRLSAKNLSGAAFFELGTLYESGLGVAADLAEALKLYGEAADRGSAPGQLRLAFAYQRGEGLPQGRSYWL